MLSTFLHNLWESRHTNLIFVPDLAGDVKKQFLNLVHEMAEKHLEELFNQIPKFEIRLCLLCNYNGISSKI